MITTCPIKYRRFGSSSVMVSELGLGCASAWGQPWFSEKQAIALVHRAQEAGITVFDTGPSYSGGYAEPRLGKALKGREPGDLLISTKVGTHIGAHGRLYHDLCPEAILRSVEASRARLGLDQIPLLYLHGLSHRELDNRLLDTLTRLRSLGWVRWLGVNSFDTQVLEAVARIPFFDAVMLDYNVLRTAREPLISRLVQSGTFVVAGAAIANHLYAPRFLCPSSLVDAWYLLRAVKNSRRDLLPALRFRSVASHGAWTTAQVALAYVLSNHLVGTAMFSTTRLAHLEENLEACALCLPEQLVEKIRGPR